MFKLLRILLIDRDMTCEDLRHPTGLSPATIAKLRKDGNVTSDILARFGEVLNCNIADISQITKKEGARNV